MVRSARNRLTAGAISIPSRIRSLFTPAASRCRPSCSATFIPADRRSTAESRSPWIARSRAPITYRAASSPLRRPRDRAQSSRQADVWLWPNRLSRRAVSREVHRRGAQRESAALCRSRFRTPCGSLGTRDVELIPGGDAVITGPVDARERSHHLVVGRRPLEQPVRGVELGAVDRRLRRGISGDSGHPRVQGVRSRHRFGDQAVDVCS